MPIEDLVKKWEREYRVEKAREVYRLFQAFLQVIKEYKPETTTILMALKMLEHATVDEKLNEFEKEISKQAPQPTPIEFRSSETKT